MVKAGNPFLLYEEQHRIVEFKKGIGIILFRVAMKNTLFLSVFAYSKKETIHEGEMMEAWKGEEMKRWKGL